MQSLTARQLIGIKLVRAVSATAFGALSVRKTGVPVRKTEFSYGAHRKERLDYLLPDDASLKPQEAVIYMHGGGWISGGKRYYPADLQFLCGAGYTVFNLGYPLAPEHPHPLLLQSILKAVAWIKQHHPQISRVHMMGDSAGANLAAMYGVLYSNPELLSCLGGNHQPDDLLHPASVVSIYGLLERESLLGDDPAQVKPVVKLFLQSYGGPDVLQPGPLAPEHAITPMDLPWKHHPPCFLGGGDIDFLSDSSDFYAQALESRGIPVERKIYPQAQHGFFNTRHEQTPVLRQDVLQFLAAH